MKADRDLEEALLDELWREHGRLSRNRNFDLYRSPPRRAAFRRYRRLRHLARDLARCGAEGEVRFVAGGGGRAVVEMALPALRFRRFVMLQAAEVALLREEPRLAALLVE